MVKHTPGPWRAEGNKVLAIDHNITFSIATCATRGRMKHTKEGEENNAKLIAAAPEMLEALTSIVSAWESPTYGDNEALTDHIGETMEQAREAIKKATS